MLILRPELSNLVACEVRETPLTLRFVECIQPASLHASFYIIIVRRGQRQVTAATGACDLGYSRWQPGLCTVGVSVSQCCSRGQFGPQSVSVWPAVGVSLATVGGSLAYVQSVSVWPNEEATDPICNCTGYNGNGVETPRWRDKKKKKKEA